VDVKFISVRELRGRSAEVWRRLGKEGELVITSNGKPIALLTPTDEDNFEDSLRELRRVRAMDAIATLQRRSVARGLDRLSSEQIDAEIAATRKSRAR